MGTMTSLPQEVLIASALRWWRDAGVDALVSEDPRRWLAENGGVKPKIRTAEASVPVVDPVRDHATRAALVEWLMTDPDLAEGGPLRRRIAPTGDPSHGLMILTDFPDHADIDAGHLLAGNLAPLFDRMLAAIGASRDHVYLASVAPGRPASGRLDDKALEALGLLARRHVALAAPQRLWIMGTAASRAILGISDLEAHGKLHSVNLNEAKVKVVVTAHPRFLTDQDKKRRAWTEMQRLIVKEYV
jgi:uracil-DNA glycosylase